MKRLKHLDLLLYFWWIVFFISVICCFRAISSITIGLVLATGLLKNKINTGSWLNRRLKNGFTAACCLFYLIQVLLLLYSDNLTESAKYLQTKSAMIFVPLALCCSSYLSGPVRQKLMKYYIWTLAAVLFYCLLLALYRYFFTGAQNDVFFYHELVSPFKQHAVQISILLFAGLVYLLEQARKAVYFYNRLFHFLLIFYFTGCMLLLSSKLVISFSAGCLVYYFFLFLKTKKNTRFITLTSLFACLLLIILVLSTQNKISKRFNEIVSGDMSLVQQQDFNPGIYFNGLQFRLLQWRFVKEILTEHHAWLTGVSDDAQTLLDKKYISTHMYTGDGTTAHRGYLGYNTHDGFLESLLQSGIPGLVSFILICYAMMHLAIRRQNRELTIMVILLIAYCFNEAVLETQYGGTLFTLFPLFLYYGTEAYSDSGPL